MDFIIQVIVAGVLLGIVTLLAYWVDKKSDYEDYE